jgi:hypothetical protein
VGRQEWAQVGYSGDFHREWALFRDKEVKGDTMKIYCKRCGGYLGEIELGKIKKGTVYLCLECMEAYKILEGLKSYSDSTKGSSSDIPKGFEDLFSQFTKKK